MKGKPKVGQTVYSIDRHKEVKEHTVTKVGRLYFYFMDGYESKVDLKNWLIKGWYRGRDQVFESRQAIKNDEYIDKTMSKIRTAFDYCRGIPKECFSIEDLKEIEAVIDRVAKLKAG